MSVTAHDPPFSRSVTGEGEDILPLRTFWSFGAICFFQRISPLVLIHRPEPDGALV